jgi:4-amino-4-deoxy-L-arabinose transferase-like glycosyltransferase
VKQPKKPPKGLETKRTGKDWLVVLAIVFIYLLLSILVFDPKLHTGGDNASYICLAKSILSGKGYRDIYMPGDPPHTQYPFGYPLLLAIVMVFFKNSFIPLKALSLLMGAGAVLIAYLLLRDWCRKPLLFGLVLLFAASPLLIEYGHWELSDVPFTFFVLLSLFLFRRAELDKRNFPPALWGTIACVVFTYYIRTVGAALFLALLFYFAQKKQFKKLLVVLAILVALALPWSIRTARVSQGGGYLTQLMLKDPYNTASGKINAGDLAKRLAANSQTYFVAAIPRTILSAAGRLLPGTTRLWAVYAFGLLASALMLLGFAHGLGKGLGFIHYFIIFYVGTLLIWPQVWATDRFVLPLVPFVLYYFVSGVLTLLYRARARTREVTGLVVVCLLAVSSVFTVAMSIPSGLRIIRAYAAGNEMAGYPPEWVRYYETATFASRFSPQDAVFVARKPNLFYLYANRKCLSYPFTFDKEKVIDTIKENHVSYVVVDAFTWTNTTGKYLVPALLAHEKEFEVIYSTERPETYVLRYIGG